MTRWPSLLIVTGSVVLMQIHAMAFWLEFVGLTGLAWSLILEAVALWLWWQRRHSLAVLASALLIAGPFYHLSAPTLGMLQDAEASARLLSLEQTEIAQLEAALARYQANSAERMGWAQRIDRTQEALDVARERLRQRLEQQPAIAHDWQAIGVVALQGATLLVVMITQVLAVGALRPATSTTATPPTPKPTPKPIPEQATPNPNAQPVHTLHQQVASAIEAELKTRNETGAAAARRLGVRPADISMIRNHLERQQAGKETVSNSVLQRLAEHYQLQHGAHA